MIYCIKTKFIDNYTLYSFRILCFFSVVGGNADILARWLIVICLSLHNSIIRSLTD